MKEYIFKRESNSFDDIIKDPTIKKVTRTKIKWKNHLLISIEGDDTVESYINLKYGDSMISELSKDFSPIIGVDYMPKKIIKI
jgi:hypothetical protein